MKKEVCDEKTNRNQYGLGRLEPAGKIEGSNMGTI
jgi:hypothetical protein